MTPSDARSAGTARSGSILAAALLAAFSSLILGLFIAARSTAGDGTGGVASGADPFWAITLLACSALVAAVGAFVAWRESSRMRRQLARLAADASRIALGEYRRPATGHERTALEPIATALVQLGTLVDAASSVITDRDRQLATVRALGEIIYWETGPDGRFARVEFEPALPRRMRLGLLGQPQFGHATPLDDTRWLAARNAIAERRSFDGLILRRFDADGRCVDVRESGQPHFGSDGSFLGYTGITRFVNCASGACTDEAARIAFETGAEPALVLGDAPGLPDVRWFNAAAGQLFGHGAPLIEGSRLDALFAPGQAEAVTALAAALRERRPLRRTMAILNRFGERIDVLARLEPVDSGAPTAVLALDPRAAEIAALRAHSRESSSLREDISRHALQLEQRTRELEAFACAISHDLRAPLRIVDGYARMMRDHCAANLDPVGREHLEHILTGCARMQRMIDAALALARTSTQPMVPATVDLGRIARETLDALACSEPQRRVEVQIGERLQAQGDPTLLRTVMENLLGNAWKYTAEREIASIRFDARRDASGTRVFCVEDNGSGFDMRHADRLFGLFQRLHPESEFPGDGLGLATVQRIVQRHGGAVWAESSPGEGACFCFTLGEPDRAGRGSHAPVRDEADQRARTCE
ncbi:MAG TPA: ATP-binding protein [Burkholderiaceae bacterium]|nr:ATP-binding protein [Burkholderiaceae bacterium]